VKLSFAHVPEPDREAAFRVSDYGALKYGVKGASEKGKPQPYFRLDRNQNGGVLDSDTRSGHILR
jgi:hypothetical protein